MRVNLPRRINDIDLDNNDGNYNIPMSQPTSMTYYLMRIQLAEICRTVVIPCLRFQIGALQITIPLSRWIRNLSDCLTVFHFSSALETQTTN